MTADHFILYSVIGAEYQARTFSQRSHTLTSLTSATSILLRASFPVRMNLTKMVKHDLFRKRSCQNHSESIPNPNPTRGSSDVLARHLTTLTPLGSKLLIDYISTFVQKFEYVCAPLYTKSASYRHGGQLVGPLPVERQLFPG